jgi:O-antigen chain-terminating methyltransferase
MRDVSESLKNNLRDTSEAMVNTKEALLGRLDETSDALAAKAAALSADVAQVIADAGSSHRKVDALEKFTLSTRAEMLLVERRLGQSLTKVQPPVTIGQAGQLSPKEPKPLLSDVLYWEFENQFRGSEEEIKGRVQIYVPRMRALGVGSPDMPIVDIGCGRGEWLDVLKESGLLGYGVDANSMVVARCRDKGLAVEEQDGLEHIKALPSSSVGAVTAFHFVEHLPPAVLMCFLDEVLRVLKPGGVVLLETPNPDNVLVGSSTFYVDPTHERPIPAGLLRFLLHSRGFGSIEVLPLHPYPDTVRLDDVDSPIARVINERFFGCQDYGVLAVRP